MQILKGDINNHSTYLRNDIIEANHSEKGIYHFQHLLRRCHIAGRYYKLFYDFFLRSQKGEELVFIDAGAHAGVFNDVALASGGICYAFESNIYLHAFLKDLYKDNKKLILSNKAVSNQNSTTIFYDGG